MNIIFLKVLENFQEETLLIHSSRDLLVRSAFCKVYPFRPFTDFFNYTEFSSLFKTSIGSLYYVFNLNILNIYMYLNIYTEYMYVFDVFSI